MPLLGDIRASADAQGELILTSESGLNIIVKDIGAEVVQVVLKCLM